MLLFKRLELALLSFQPRLQTTGARVSQVERRWVAIRAYDPPASCMGSTVRGSLPSSSAYGKNSHNSPMAMFLSSATFSCPFSYDRLTAYSLMAWEGRPHLPRNSDLVSGPAEPRVPFWPVGFPPPLAPFPPAALRRAPATAGALLERHGPPSEG